MSRLTATLEHLSFQVAAGVEIDLDALPRLRSLAAHWSPISATLHAPHYLDALTLLNYDGTDLVPLAVQPSLQTLDIKIASHLESLDGVEQFPTLMSVKVGAGRRLADLRQISAATPTLRSLELERCPRVTELDAVGDLDELRVLTLGDCGPIPTIRPLGKLTQLEYLGAWGTTNVEDGDLSPLLQLTNLRELRMRDRPHYRPRVAEIAASVF